MNPLLYLKAVIGAVGATVFPPICSWLVSFLPGHPPASVQTAITVLLVAILTGGSIYATPNKAPTQTTNTTVSGDGGSVKSTASA